MNDNEPEIKLVTEDKEEKTQYRVWFISLLGIVAIAASGLLVQDWIKNKPKPKPAVIIKSTPIIDVYNFTLKPNQITIKAQGIVKPKLQSKISSQVTGNVTYINSKLEIGNIIGKNTKLIEVDNTDYLLALATAKSNWATANTNLVTEKAKAKQAKKDLRRVGIKPTDLSLRKPQITQAKLALESADAAIDNANKSLERTTIKSPFKAIIMTKNISVGELITTGANVASLVSLDEFSVNIPLSENDIKLIQNDKNPKIKIYNSTNTGIFISKISRYAASIDITNRTLSAYADITNPYEDQDNLLRLESFVDVDILGNTFLNSIWVNNTSIIDHKYIWGVTSDNTLKKVAIDILHSEGEKNLLHIMTDKLKYIVNVPSLSFVDNDKVEINIIEK